MGFSLVGAQQGFGTLSGNIRWTCYGKKKKMKEIYDMLNENKCFLTGKK